MSGTKEDQINYRIKKSQETFDDAKYDAAGGRLNACINRLYYSSFAILTALLLKNNIEAKSHKGIRIQFHHHFVELFLYYFRLLLLMPFNYFNYYYIYLY